MPMYSSSWCIAEVLLAGADRLVVIAGGEFGIGEQVTNLLAEAALRLGLEDLAKVSLSCFWIAGLKSGHA